MKFIDNTGLEINFNPAAKLEVLISDNFFGTRWTETSSEMFRSWSGDRRINGVTFNEPVYKFLSNETVEVVKETVIA
jgi:hypothetical protein